MSQAIVPISPSPAKWAASNSHNMLKARTLTQNMMKQVRVNEENERANKDAGMEQIAREKQQKHDDVFAKAAAHGAIIATSSDCTFKMEDGALCTSNSISLLKQNRSLAFASTQVCKRRLQLRARRPKTELIKDYVHIALESEKSLLETAREEYLQMEEDGRKISADLEKFRDCLSQDTGTRRLVMKKDQQTLRPHLAPPPERQRPCPEFKDEDSHSLLEDTFNLLERSNKHRDKSLELIMRIKNDSKSAVTRVEECLEKRTDELNALLLDLKKHMADAEAAIIVSERSLDKSTKRLDPNDQGKKEKLIRDKALLDQLKTHKEKLHTEIQNKFIALEIDNMCRRVTACKACEPSLMDANAALEKAAGLGNSASAPNLLSTAGSNMTGGTKLPSLAGTKDDFASSKGFANGSPKFSSASSPLSSSGSSPALGMKVKH